MFHRQQCNNTDFPFSNTYLLQSSTHRLFWAGFQQTAISVASSRENSTISCFQNDLFKSSFQFGDPAYLRIRLSHNANIWRNRNIPPVATLYGSWLIRVRHPWSIASRLLNLSGIPPLVCDPVPRMRNHSAASSPHHQGHRHGAV